MSTPPHIADRARRRSRLLGGGDGSLGRMRSGRWPQGASEGETLSAPVAETHHRPIIERGHAGNAARRDRAYRRALVIADILSIVASIVVSVVLVEGTQPIWASLLAIPAIVVVARLAGLYDRDELVLRKTTLDEAPKIFHVATLAALIGGLFDRVLAEDALGQWAVLSLWIGLFGSLLVTRFTARAIQSSRLPVERCMVLGSLEASEEVKSKLAITHAVSAEVVQRMEFTRGMIRQLLPLLESVVRDNHIERVIIAPKQVDQSEILDVVRSMKAMGVNVTLVPRIFEVLGSSVVFDDVSGLQLLAMRRLRMSRSSLILKRAFDIAVSGAAILALSPFLLVGALLVRIDSRGPIFFRQTRVGRDGERFQILKFRTMVDGADKMKDELRQENETNGLFKIADDPRITRVGRILRKTSIDELPQLINVFRGDMSLVGPRPLVVDEDSQIVGWHRRRLALTPGMTGQWQILGSAKIPLQEMVKIDYLYVTNWSFWTDLKILIRTVPYVLRGGGL